MQDTLSDRLIRAWPHAGTTILFVGSVVWLMWPAQPWAFNPEAALAVFGAFTTWVSVLLLKPPEGVDARRSAIPPPHIPHQHDLELYARVTDTFSRQERAFLRDHTFRNQIDSSWLEGMEIIANWRAALHIGA